MVEDSQLAYGIQAASDAQGNVLVVWDDLEGEVNAKRYDASKQTWTTSQQLDPDNADDSAIPDLALDAQGNAIAVWQRQSQVDDMRSVWTSRYDASKGTWGAAQLIVNSDLVLAPQLAMDGAGNAVLAFTRSEIGASVMTAHFDVARGSWSEAEPLTPAQGVLAGAPQLAMAPGGKGVVIWIDGDPVGNTTIWAARYETKSAAWGDKQKIGARVGMALPTSVAINEAGSAVAVWAQTEGERSSVWTSRSQLPRGEWSEPQRLDLEGRGDVLLPRMVLDEAGNALAVWSADQDGRRSAWANRYSAADGAWRGAETLDAGDFDAFTPTPSVDGDGNVVVVWTRQGPTRRSPWTRSYTAADGTWSAPQPLDAEVDVHSEYVELGQVSDGRALAIWDRGGSKLVASHLR